MEEKNYLIAIAHWLKFGPASLARLKALGAWSTVWQADSEHLTRVGITADLAQEFIGWRQTIKIEELLAELNKHQIKTISLEEDLYPPLLKNIFQPPPLLFYQGELRAELYERTLAVVGSRRATAYGQMAVKSLVKNLAETGITIVSGLALGIDALAHEATLASHGQTIAVLGSGIDRPSFYPKANRYLADKIINNGGVIFSEFPPGTQANKFNFPRRNRLISGLAQGTLVVEAAAKSGSLITAHYALEQGREVMAVPGNIFSEQSAGANHLLKLGAKPVTKVEDIQEVFGWENIGVSDEVINDLSEIEKQILQALNTEAKHLDELKVLLNVDIGVITATLTLMEVKGLIKNSGQLNYIKNVF
jgi:DNA processing protein